MTSTAPSSQPVPLSSVPAGSRCVVSALKDVPGSRIAAELAREGLQPGSVIFVTSRTPLGGPVVIQLGRARLALSADIASHVTAVPCDEHPGLDGTR